MQRPFLSKATNALTLAGRRNYAAPSQFKPSDFQQSSEPRAKSFLHNDNWDWTPEQRDCREAIAKICKKYPDEYWLHCDENHKWPIEFKNDLAATGWLGMCLPEEYGGSNMGISEAAVVMQTIAESGAGIAGCSSVHINIFGLAPVAKFGNAEQKAKYLPPVAEGKETACFGVTEPNTGLDTLSLQTTAVKKGDKYIVNGSKMWTTNAKTANNMLLLARTTPLDKVKKRSQGLSLFYTPLDRSKIEIREINKMGRACIDTNMVFMENWEVPESDRIGEEGNGFKQIMHGINAERIIVAAQSVGLGFAALRRAANYATERSVFGRQIGSNQSIQFPLADSWMCLEATRLLIYQAARMYDAGATTGEYANAAKYLASRAAFKACERAILTHGGVGYAKEYHVERYMREIIIPRIAPVSEQMILSYIAEKVIGQKKSY